MSLPVCDHIDLDILQVVNKSVVQKHSTEGAYNHEMYFFVSLSAVKMLQCKELSFFLDFIYFWRTRKRSRHVCAHWRARACICARMAHRTKHGCLIHVCNTDTSHVLYNTSLLGKYYLDMIAVS
jgi:hypothetical protein